MPQQHPVQLDEDDLEKIERKATQVVHDAGRMLEEYFGDMELEVTYKGEGKGDPVTVADREVQNFIADEVYQTFPNHGFLGEEGTSCDNRPAPDIIWVADPLDGTRNFASSLPIFACSIGVLYQGVPIVGAIYIPWRGEEGNLVLHARKGSGAFAGEAKLMVDCSETPDGHKSVALSAAFSRVFRVGQPLRSTLGDMRVSGSIVFDLALTAKASVQYAVTTGGRLWDFAGGATILSEAGATILFGSRSHTGLMKRAKTTWRTLETFVPDWRSGETSMGHLRNWSAPMVIGNPKIASYVADNLKIAKR